MSSKPAGACPRLNHPKFCLFLRGARFLRAWRWLIRSASAAQALESISSRESAGSLPYFGRTFGSPPGLPGGGITGVLPVSGVGARISGSTPEGGHNTPSDLASLSPSGSARWPVVAPSGATVPRCGAGCIGAQSLARPTAGGAVWAGGVAGAGGACALAAPAAASSTHEIKN